jgi:fatty-acyl-CoA synthase
MAEVTPPYVMDMPLLLSSMLVRTARHHRHAEIVSARPDGIQRHRYADCELRARRVAQMLASLGAGPGDRIGTLAWNDHRHYELYFGISGHGAICHTVNPRLFPEQIVHIINDAQDRFVVFSTDFLPLLQAIAPQCPSVEGWIALDPVPDGTLIGASAPRDFETLLAAQDGDYAWPELDERSPAFLCYTSGTTGLPKGVVYTHRSTVLHTYATALPDSYRLSALDTVMPAVPMFHANAWESVFVATLVGANLVLPGSKLDGASLHRLMEAEQVTFSIGVPTIWFNLLTHVQQHGLRFSSLRTLIVGGAATPMSTFEGYAQLGVELVQGWGMTETAALTTCNRPAACERGRTATQQPATAMRQGRIVAGADMRVVDEQGNDIPWGSGRSGHFQVKAPWVTARYYRADAPATQDGWLPTGDMAEIDADGHARLTDRSKDVIKSGGEWISSVDLENIAADLPGVQLAACIAATHPKWGERPLLIIQRKDDADLDEAEVLAFFRGKVPRWSEPDAVVFIDQMPLTATGKLYKLPLRQHYRDLLVSTAKVSS